MAEQLAPADLAELPPADVVIVGEIHDNPVHHANQARVVEALRPGALVFEMITPERALRVTPELRDDAQALERALEWEAQGWPDFDLYHPIFLAAPDAAVFGGGAPREAVRQAVSDGAAAMFGAAAPLFGLDEGLPEEEAAERQAEQMSAHCDAIPETMLPGMVEAQRLRDAALARAVIAALAEAGPPVVVITGNGHARTDRGVPHALGIARPELDVLSLGQLEQQPERPPPFDLWLVTEAAERADPCASLR